MVLMKSVVLPDMVYRSLVPRLKNIPKQEAVWKQHFVMTLH